MIQTPRRWTALLLAVLASICVLVLLFVDAGTLPDPIATHWGPSGKADGAMGKQALVASMLVLLIGLGTASLLASKPQWRVSTLGLVAGFGAMFTCIAWSVRTLNQGAHHWSDARNMPLFHLLIVVSAMLLPLGWCLIRYRAFFEGSGGGLTVPGLPLKPGERAVWLSSARNEWLWLLVAPALPILIFTRSAPGHVFWIVLASLVGVGLLADGFSLLRVRIDRTGVCITYGRLGLVRQRVAISEVSHAETLELKPMEHGGWGYRGSLLLMKRAAVVVRAGSALRLTLRNGRHLTVTVDDPAEGAALLNGLVKS